MIIYHLIDEEGNLIPSGSIVVISKEDQELITENHVRSWDGAPGFNAPKYDRQSNAWYEGKSTEDIEKERLELQVLQEELFNPNNTIQNLKQQLKDTQELVNMMMFGGM